MLLNLIFFYCCSNNNYIGIRSLTNVSSEPVTYRTDIIVIKNTVMGVGWVRNLNSCVSHVQFVTWIVAKTGCAPVTCSGATVGRLRRQESCDMAGYNLQIDKIQHISPLISKKACQFSKYNSPC